METNLIYASAGGIRTYHPLLDSRHAVQMQLMVILLHYVYMILLHYVYMVEDGEP